MQRFDDDGAQGDARLNWRAAALLGLITSTWSTLVSQFAAGRIGRDAAVDWMVVASIPLQDAALQAVPGTWVILAGVLFHQAADFLWAVVFFGLLGRWTARLSPWTIAAVGIPWAVMTSSIEYFLVVPFWQPVFVLVQPYWIGLLVHVTSASLYPLFPALRDWLRGRSPSPHRRFAAGWTGLAVAGGLACGALAFLGASGREWPPHSAEPDRAEYDQAFMRRMAAHHRQGVELAGIAMRSAADPHLRSLGALMVAEQSGDLAVFDQWWRSWFGAPAVPPASPGEHAAMPGMIAPADIAALRELEAGPGFDPRFVQLMTRHHEGAIEMADEAWRQGGDPRLRVMAHAIRQSQRGEIELMRGIPRGFAVSAAAFSALVAPAGQGSAERRNREAGEAPPSAPGGHP